MDHESIFSEGYWKRWGLVVKIKKQATPESRLGANAKQFAFEIILVRPYPPV